MYYNRIDVSKGIDVNKTRAKNCIICHYWHFLDKGLRLQRTAYNGCSP